MKFLRFAKGNKIKDGVLQENQIIEIPFDLLDSLKNPEMALKNANNSYQLEKVKIIPPVKPSKIICVA